MTFSEMNEGVRSITTSTVPSDVADRADDRVGLSRVELSGHDFRAAKPVAHGYGIGELMRAKKNAILLPVAGPESRRRERLARPRRRSGY